jgi:uncharacterized membrane protein
MDSVDELKNEGIIIDEKKVALLLMKLIVIEKKNTKSKQYNDRQMVDKIKKMIEEEVGCY